MIRQAFRLLRQKLSSAWAKVFPVHFKHASELRYWRSKAETEKTLRNEHYAYFYTAFWKLSGSFYADKKLLDIGCGPRGSLEWADMARERIGLDPLAASYRSLGVDRHKMRYVCAPSEQVPFPDGYFDIVCSFNSLDHVDNVNKTVQEIKRVTRAGGTFLLIVEVNHAPTATEPAALEWDISRRFTDAFMLESERRYEIGDHDIYGQLRTDRFFDSSNRVNRAGIVAASFRRL